MTLRRNVLSFSRGPFKPHGDIEYWTEDGLLRYVAHGPFNREAFEALAEASRQLHAAQPFKQPFAHLTEIHGNALAPLDAIQTFERFLSGMAKMGNNGIAVALVMAPEVEGRAIMVPKFERAYARLGLPYDCFESTAAACEWLRPKLSTAPTRCS